MQQAWYRKYRPAVFAEVVGQNHVKLTLKNQVASGTVAHAYLFAGPKGTGKTSMARILARSVNCIALKDGEACGKCAMCQAFDAGQMMDLIEIDAASHTGVDNIRELIGKVNLSPSLGKFKIYVIDEVHMLSKGAFNALLKTLEEPPSHAIFVLATTEIDKIPATIISRCQRFDFKYFSKTEIAEWLDSVAKSENLKIDQTATRFIAEQAGGGMRDALSLLEQASQIEGEITTDVLAKWFGFIDFETVVNLTQLTFAGKTKEAVLLIGRIYQDGYDLSNLAKAWLGLARQLLAAKLKNENELDLSADRRDQLIQLAKQIQSNELIWWLSEMITLHQQVKSSAIAPMPLELMVVKLAARLGHESKTDSGSDNQPPSQPVASEVAKPVEAANEPIAEGPARVASQELDWSAIVQAVREESPTLAAVLGKAQTSWDGAELAVSFHLPFYKESLEQPANLAILSRSVEKLLGACTIRCLVDQKLKPRETLVVEDVIQVFGEA